MGHRSRHDPGPHQHAEGMHGDKTHARFIEQLQERSAQSGSVDESQRATEAKGRDIAGHHRLEEGREQHDEAEKNSEKKREIPHEGDAT